MLHTVMYLISLFPTILFSNSCSKHTHLSLVEYPYPKPEPV